MSTKYSVKWDVLQLKCGSCGGELQIRDGAFGCFYSCEKYPACYNRVNVEIYEKILDYITKLISEEPETNFTSHKWAYKRGHQHYQFKVAKHKPDKFIIEAVNIKKTKVAQK